VLDWVGPVVAALGDASPHAFEMHRHDDEQIKALSAKVVRKPQLTETQTYFAQLKAISPAPADDPAATRVIDRLVRPYGFEPYTRIPAVNSVTALTKSGRAAPAGQSPSRLPLVSFEQHLPLPKSIAADRSLSPLEIGAATHSVLQYLDFTHLPTAAVVRQQIAHMAAKKLIVDAHISSVDVDAIVWLMNSELGSLLREAGKRVRRELSLQFPAPPDLAASAAPSEDPLDRVMIRGRIDVLLETSDGRLIVADYKTDQLTPETLPP